MLKLSSTRNGAELLNTDFLAYPTGMGGPS